MAFFPPVIYQILFTKAWENGINKSNTNKWSGNNVTQKWYPNHGINQNLIHPMIPVLKIISGHPIAINANTQAKLIFTLFTSFGLNFFKSKCQINLKNLKTIMWTIKLTYHMRYLNSR